MIDNHEIDYRIFGSEMQCVEIELDPQETVTASDGSTSTVGTFIALGLRGTGISAVGLPGNNTLALSINK